ncbi:hypothetical protein [Nitrosomonas communis]|uniref:hypothetical protein n=1 Tax=Nitrosomonas communis TaxID=44574 RepID=UPI000AF010EB|nr:hypothetical protein [Nitrosomonas communis]
MSDIRIHKTGAADVIASSDSRLILSVPIQIKRRSGHRVVTSPKWRNHKGSTLGYCGGTATVGVG